MTDSAALSLADEIGKLIDWLADEGYDQENYDFLFTVQTTLRSLQAENEAITEGGRALVKQLRERLAATEAVAKRLWENWSPDEHGEFWTHPLAEWEPMSDAERQVLDRL